MTKLYEKKFDEDAEIKITLSETKNKFTWSPELFGHRGWNLKVTDPSGFEFHKLKTGDVFSLSESGAHYLFCYDKQSFIINRQTCLNLMNNSVKL